MIDIELLREDSEKVKKQIASKQFDPALVDKALELDKKWRENLRVVEELRRERNEVARKRTPEAISRGQQIKKELKELDEELDTVTNQYEEALRLIPNPPADDAPVGVNDKENVEVRKWGEVPQFDFLPKDHVQLAASLDIIDFERGAKVSGSDFYYLKNDGALLEIALVAYGFEFLTKKGFTPFITPDLARERYYLGTGYLPKGNEAQTYTIEDSDLGLIATAEVTLAGYHADELLSEKDLPKRYTGYSHCFRQEAGSYGKYSKGLYRVHQFTKVEMFIYCFPDQSSKMHQEILGLEEEFWQTLGIPYRVLEMCTGDLGAQAVKKYDLEAWMPGRGDWGEITSTSNTTDYQARRLNIRFQKEGVTGFAHTLNGTLVATSRGLISVLENYQQADGSIVVPEVLRKWMGKDKITSK